VLAALSLMTCLSTAFPEDYEEEKARNSQISSAEALSTCECIKLLTYTSLLCALKTFSFDSTLYRENCMQIRARDFGAYGATEKFHVDCFN
jgi:hypothetical protein